MKDKLLFGLPGAEQLKSELADVVDDVLAEHDDPLNCKPFTVEEWTTYPPEEWLPDVDKILDWITEHTAEETIDEECAGEYDAAIKEQDVRTAAHLLIVLIASKVKYLMAKDCVAVHRITIDDKGEPRVNGAPLYRKVTDES